jgi:hypothetical protein
MQRKQTINIFRSIQSITSVLLFIFLVNNGFGQNLEQSQQQEFNPQTAIKNIDELMYKYHYDKDILDSPEYKKIQKSVKELDLSSNAKKDFIDGFNKLWYEGPFSHVRLAEARQSAEKLADYLDAMNVEGKGAELSWMDNIAILTVHTMMGLNTIEQINDAYEIVIKKDAKALIIDLRENQGGAFAVKPLTGHLLNMEYNAGIFLSNAWTINNKGLPSEEYISGLEPWRGWSIKSFWKDAQENGVLKIVMKPMQPNYSGPVYVLISKKTASAAELAADILLSSERATLIGETTEGAMLSQKMYDLPQGLQLSLPIADYYSLKYGRIEGVGVKPNILIESKMAMDKAVELIRKD